MAPSELVWQAEDDDACRSTAPWLASGAAGLELRPRADCSSATSLRELRPGAEPRTVATVVFAADGRRWVAEQLPSGRVQHKLPGRASVRLRWEKAAGRWKLWLEAGERLVLEATFESPEPQLELHALSTCVDLFDVSLLPLPGPDGTLQSPPPAHAQLQARIDQLTAELEESKHQCQVLEREKAEEADQKAEIQQEKQNLQQQLDELTVEKAAETKKVEALQRENKALQRSVLTPEVQRSGELARRISQLKEDCDDVLAFIHPDTSDSRDEAPGATPGSFSLVGDQPDVESASDASNVTDSFILVDAGDQSDAQSISDASSRSAKCFAPNTVLPGADGHLLRVEKLRIGDRVRLRDLTDVEVAGIKAHRKSPYDLVQLTTRQGRFTVSKDHRVAVPGPGCQGAQRADQLSEGDLVIVGGKNQKLTKVSHLQECTVLYEVAFKEDQSVEMFHIESYGLVTFGSAVAAESAASASDGPLPALEHIGPGN